MTTEDLDRQLKQPMRHPMNRRRFLFISAMTAGAAVLAACGGDDDDETPSGGGAGTGSTATTAPTSAATTAATSGQSTPAATSDATAAATTSGGTTGGTLVIAQDQDPRNWDPHDSYDLVTEPVSHNVYGALLFRNPELELEPDLAETWENVDDMTWEFTLRSGVTFHNGYDFTAEDVKFSLDRVRDPETNAPHRSLYQTISEVVIVDEQTVQVKTSEPDPVLAVKLSGYGGRIMSQQYFDEVGKETYSQEPVGTGPFRITEWVKDSHTTLEAFEDYWQGSLLLQTVTVRTISDQNTRMAELLAGGVDIAKRVHPSQVEEINGSDLAQVMETGGLTVVSYRMNTTMAPVDNVNVRKALVHAIDMDTIIETIFEGFGRRIPIQMTELHVGFNADLEPYPYDPEMAQTLLAEAGMDAIEVQLDIPSGDLAAKDMAEVIVAQWAEIGVTANLTISEVATFTDRQYGGELGHMWETGWGGWTADADNTYWSLYATPGQENYREGVVFYSNTELDGILEEARYEMDPEARQELYDQAGQIIYDEVPQLPLLQRVELWGVNNRVQGFVPPSDHRFWLYTVTVSE